MNYTRHLPYIVLILISFAIPFAAVCAEQGASCPELIKDCFASSPERRDTCLQSAATTSLCSSSDMSQLIAKRSQFSEINQPTHDQGPAFLGPQLINRTCVTNFDTAWSAALVNGPLSKQTIAGLSATLDECAMPEAQSIPRP